MDRIQLNGLNNWLSQPSRKPLVIRGARQVGKSTLVRTFAKNSGREILEINLEKHPELDPIFKKLDIALILSNLEGLLKKTIKPEKHLLFLDEVQGTPHALAALRYFYEERSDLPVIAAGSLLEFVLSDHAFSMPVGRIEYLHMFPMTFCEFLLAQNEEWLLEKIHQFDITKPWPESVHTKLLVHYRNYLFIGGMPEAVLNFSRHGSNKACQKIQDSIAQTYRDDFSKYGSKTEIQILQRIYASLPSQLGKKTIFSNIAKDLRAAQVRNAIEMLEGARIIGRVFHTDAQNIPIASQIDRNVFKAYWLDCGLLNRMLGVVSDKVPFDHKLLHEGLLAEQFVFQHLPIFQSTHSRPDYFYWLREGKIQNSEVDFVVQHGKHVIPIEVKSSKSGRLKSVHQFVNSHPSRLAVKLSAELPLLQNVVHGVLEKGASKRIEFRLLNLPLYLIETLPRVLESLL